MKYGLFNGRKGALANSLNWLSAQELDFFFRNRKTKILNWLADSTMKTLYLVRHAKSSWDFPELADIDRPLNSRGAKNAPQMGKRLRQKGIKPDLLLSSPANRAITTALEIAKEIGYPIEAVMRSRDVYHADERELLRIVRQQDNKHSSLMLFGHNPGFTWFANFLTGEHIDNIPTAGIVAITLDCDSWQDANNKLGKLDFFDYPKKPGII